MTRIIIWRHGLTDANLARTFQGQTDVPLNDTGRQQAEAAAAKLAHMRPDLLISSDLSRCSETAAALSRASGLPVELDKRLRERSFGAWEGLNFEQVMERFPDEVNRWHAGAIQPGDNPELTSELAKRMAEAIRDAALRVPEGLAVLVSHGGSTKWGINTILEWSEDRGEQLRGMDNCHWSELAFTTARGWVLVNYNVGV